MIAGRFIELVRYVLMCVCVRVWWLSAGRGGGSADESTAVHRAPQTQTPQPRQAGKADNWGKVGDLKMHTYVHALIIGSNSDSNDIM